MAVNSREALMKTSWGKPVHITSFIHALEIEARVPGLHGEETTVLNVFDYDNTLHQIEYHWHAPKICKYPDLEPVVEQAGGLTCGQVGSSLEYETSNCLTSLSRDD
jgi:hypothetical protein